MQFWLEKTGLLHCCPVAFLFVLPQISNLSMQVLLCGSPNHLDPQDTAPHTPQKTFSEPPGGMSPLDLGGSRKWAHAVSTLARHVHGAPGEYVSTLFAAVQELEEQAERVENTGGGGEVQAAWLRCLAVVGLLLQEVKGLEELREGGAASMEMFEKCVVAQVRRGGSKAGEKCECCYWSQMR
jgi:hypothetical protein